MLAKSMIEDKTGKTDTMCPDDYGTQVEFGGDILAIAQRLL